MVGNGFNKNLPYFLGHFVGLVLLQLSRRPLVAMVAVVCSDCNLFYHSVYSRKVMEKKTVFIGMIIGSVIGGYVPALWGAGLFSISSIIGGAIGGILGIWLTFKFLSWLTIFSHSQECWNVVSRRGKTRCPLAYKASSKPAQKPSSEDSMPALPTLHTKWELPRS